MFRSRASLCVWKQTKSRKNRTRGKTNEPFFLHSFGTERVAANHCTDGGLYLPTKSGRFRVRVRDGSPGLPCFIGVGVLSGGESGPWTVVHSGLVVHREVGVGTRTVVHSGLAVTREVGVGTRTGKLWVRVPRGVNREVVLLLQNRPVSEERTEGEEEVAYMGFSEKWHVNVGDGC